MLNVSYFEIDIVKGCNQRCFHCSHFSPYRQGFVPLDDIVHWFETWNEKILPAKLQLVGGEPFLHPDFVEVLRESRRIWTEAQIGVLTNGTLIEDASPEVFDTLRETEITVWVSDHSVTSDALVRLRDNGIRCRLFRRKAQWRKRYLFSKTGKPVPFQSDPRKAWENCWAKRCPSLLNNKMYKCCLLASMVDAVEGGTLSSTAWKKALKHQPLSPDADEEMMREFFQTEEVDACSLCPDRIEIIEHRQL